MSAKNRGPKVAIALVLGLICALLAQGQGQEALAYTVKPPTEEAPAPPQAPAPKPTPKPKPKKKPVVRPEPEEEASPAHRSSRFTVSSEGIIRDSKTGLEWYVGQYRDTTWYEADDWVRGLTVGGGGWRMPTLRELQDIYIRDAGIINMDDLFTSKGVSFSVWSGERDSSSAVAFDFINKKVLRLIPDTPSSRAFAARSRR